MVGGPSVVCDPGVDDFLALLVLAGAGVPPSDVVGTAGNVDAELAFRNAAGIVSVLGLDRSVAKGCEEGLSGPYPDTGEPFHGTDGLGGIGSVLRVAAPGTALDPVLIVKGTVLATGPLTIVATALSAGNAIEDIVWMGGTVACGGNMTPSAEFNAWLDPEAADQVLSSSKSLGHGLSRRVAVPHVHPVQDFRSRALPEVWRRPCAVSRRRLLSGWTTTQSWLLVRQRG